MLIKKYSHLRAYRRITTSALILGAASLLSAPVLAADEEQGDGIHIGPPGVGVSIGGGKGLQIGTDKAGFKLNGDGLRIGTDENGVKVDGEGARAGSDEHGVKIDGDGARAGSDERGVKIDGDGARAGSDSSGVSIGEE